MIDLTNFIAAIRSSTLEASDALIERNQALLEGFFREAKSDDDLDTVVQMASSVSSDAAETGSPDALRKAAEQLKDSAEALKQRQGHSSTLVPVTVAMQYPRMTAEGPEVHVVHVPLISLAPVTSTQLKELRLRTDLELSVVSGALKVGFPSEDEGTTDTSETQEPSRPKTQRAKASLEILVSAAEPPPGVKLIIEGYHRALRAQIPG